MNPTALQVLLIDDDDVPGFILQDHLHRPYGPIFSLRCASSLAEGLRALAQGGIDAVLLDLGLPDSTGSHTFHAVHDGFPRLPIVVLTGTDDENVGLELVHAGAQDYLVKGQISAPLVCRALRYAIERQRLMLELQQALGEVKTLSGLLPICSGCKRIRDHQGSWIHLETYISARSEASFSHGLCPECIPKYFPNL